FAACRPLGPRVTSNSTPSPTARVLKASPWIAEKWTNTSSPPSWEMNPKPFASLNHFTVPLATVVLLRLRNPRGSPLRPRRAAGDAPTPPRGFRQNKKPRVGRTRGVTIGGQEELRDTRGKS